MEINRNNYEAFLLDLMEGRLSLSDQQKVRDFLKLNPDCSAPLYDSELWVLENRNTLFAGKEKLKKEFINSDSVISESNFDLFSIARMEGDLTGGQERDHQNMVDEDERRNQEWSQWQHTRLLTPAVEYRGKRALKRKAGLSRGIIWLGVLSSAAALALLLIFVRVDTDANRTQLADEIPDQASTVLDPQTTTGPDNSPVEKGDDSTLPAGESLAAKDEPVMFSIKKRTDRTVESEGLREPSAAGVNQDTLLSSDQKKVEARPLKLAGFDPITAATTHAVDYDKIRPLDIPPIKASISNLSLAQIAEIDVQQALDNYTEEKDISLYSIANAGLQGINKITGAEMSLLASRNESGDVSGIRFKSKRFSFTRPIERSE